MREPRLRRTAERRQDRGSFAALDPKRSGGRTLVPDARFAPLVESKPHSARNGARLGALHGRGASVPERGDFLTLPIGPALLRSAGLVAPSGHEDGAQRAKARDRAGMRAWWNACEFPRAAHAWQRAAGLPVCGKAYRSGRHVTHRRGRRPSSARTSMSRGLLAWRSMHAVWGDAQRPAEVNPPGLSLDQEVVHTVTLKFGGK
jgi:hypothetical protein